MPVHFAAYNLKKTSYIYRVIENQDVAFSARDIWCTLLLKANNHSKMILRLWKLISLMRFERSTSEARYIAWMVFLLQYTMYLLALMLIDKSTCPEPVSIRFWSDRAIDVVNSVSSQAWWIVVLKQSCCVTAWERWCSRAVWWRARKMSADSMQRWVVCLCPQFFQESIGTFLNGLSFLDQNSKTTIVGQIEDSTRD